MSLHKFDNKVFLSVPLNNGAYTKSDIGGSDCPRCIKGAFMYACGLDIGWTNKPQSEYISTVLNIGEALLLRGFPQYAKLYVSRALKGIDKVELGGFWAGSIVSNPFLKYGGTPKPFSMCLAIPCTKVKTMIKETVNV